ncbi:ArgS-related anticodon-binding protein NrtL [Streptomyces sp. NPDC046985]|uniref:ArgS-related anticodon-binding protein NrtL n=1 Tax=Streptomyces sp. NPDC046985 TaxID=3155377 RepID=UPI0033C46883
MTPVELSRTVLCAVRRAVELGELSAEAPERVVVTRPGAGGCGDYATSVALQLARAAGQPAHRVAETLRAHLLDADGIRDVVVTGPGFLNISLRDSDADSAAARLVAEVLRLGQRYGFGQAAAGQVHRLHCAADVRALVVGEVAARLLRSQGALVLTPRDQPVPPAWADVLGAHVDESGPAPLDATVRPVPAVVRPMSAVVRPVPVAADDIAGLLALGRDAGRWALLQPAGHDRPRIDETHLLQREGNPLFRVRYAHARTRALLRNAADLGFAPEPGALGRPTSATDPMGAASCLAGQQDPTRHEYPARHENPTRHPDPARPENPTRHADPARHGNPPSHGDPTGQDLLAALSDHPRVLAQAGAHRAPDRLARHLVAVADAVLPLLPGVLPLGEEKPSAAHRARLALAVAAGTVLAGGLSLLGIDAPDHL